MQVVNAPNEDRSGLIGGMCINTLGDEAVRAPARGQTH